jgi:hypothetical protein
MPGVRRGLVVLLILAGALGWAGCSTVAGSSTDDSEIISALHLKKSDGGYEINGEPFCQIDQLLNDVDEVNSAGDEKGPNFVIASPNGAVGVVAHPPFAPNCKREAEAALKKLARKSSNSD